MSPSFTKFVDARIRAVARQIGAPVNMDETCAPNLQIIFTERPQEMLDTIRTKLPALPGYHYAAQAKALRASDPRLARHRHPRPHGPAHPR